MEQMILFRKPVVPHCLFELLYNLILTCFSNSGYTRLDKDLININTGINMRIKLSVGARKYKIL